MAREDTCARCSLQGIGLPLRGALLVLPWISIVSSPAQYDKGHRSIHASLGFVTEGGRDISRSFLCRWRLHSQLDIPVILVLALDYLLSSAEVS